MLQLHVSSEKLALREWCVLKKVARLELFFIPSCMWTKCDMFFLELLPFSVQHIHFRKVGRGGGHLQVLKKIYRPRVIFKVLGPPWLTVVFLHGSRARRQRTRALPLLKISQLQISRRLVLIVRFLGDRYSFDFRTVQPNFHVHSFTRRHIIAHVFAMRLASDDDDMASRRCTRLTMVACPRLHTCGTRPSLFCW